MARHFLREIEQRFSLTFWGFFWAIVFGLISIYATFIKQSKPGLHYSIVENYGVFDVKEEVGKLQVFYEGSNLNERKEDLRVITFQVKNDGDASILQNFYDPNYPLGFKVVNGRVVEQPTLINASSDYLKDHVVITKTGDQAFNFSNTIIDAGDFFEVKVLVLHGIEEKPDIKSLGKVAEVGRIYVSALNDSQKEKSTFSLMFGGGLGVFFGRLFVYGVMFFFVVGLVIYIEEKFTEYRDARARRKNSANFRDVYSNRISGEDEVFFSEYMEGGVKGLQKIQSLLSGKRLSLLNKLDSGNPEVVARYGVDLELFKRLKAVGVVKEQEGEPVVREESLAILVDFISYLERRTPVVNEETIKVFSK
jgi:hypothetical protein